MVDPGATTPTFEQLRAFVRARGSAFLDDRNINSVGIGHRVAGGVRTSTLCVQFTVHSKADGTALEALDTAPIPTQIEFDGVQIPTDVVQRRFRPGYELVELERKSDRKRRVDPLRAGVSVSHAGGTAGTLGAIVFDSRTGAACMLSNWHVLHTPSGQVGDEVVQPGPYDDNHVAKNRAGVLVRSHLGLAGDCAIARIEGRGFHSEILDLGVVVEEVAKPELGDRVVKSGRTTAVTYGIVRRVETITKMDYGAPVGEARIGGFEIGPDEQHGDVPPVVEIEQRQG